MVCYPPLPRPLDLSASSSPPCGSIVQLLPSETKNLWEVVALMLDTGHSAWECNHQFVLATSRSSRGGEGGGGTKKDVTPPAITTKVGTMKRKRQLRNAPEHLDKGYSDDIFDSTPFARTVESSLTHLTHKWLWPIHRVSEYVRFEGGRTI